MSRVSAPILTMLAVTIVACSRSGTVTEPPPDDAPEFLTAATLGEQVILPSADYLKFPEYRNADAKYGRNLAMQCRTCHSLDEGSSSPLGPSLYGLFGRRAGSLDDYTYSPALAQADFVWTPRALDAWLAAPWRFVPGNRMAYAGLSDAAARAALIAVLLRMTEPEATEGA